MAARTSRSRSGSRRRKPAGPLSRIRGLTGRGRRGRMTGFGLVLALGGWFFGADLIAWLPEPAADAAREAEGWIEATLRDLGGRTSPGTTVPTEGQAPAGQGSPEAEPLDAASVAEVLVLLERIPVENERPRGYDRDAWPHWIDADGDCMDARHEVLLSESLERAQLTGDSCRVIRGAWFDPYTGETLSDPSGLDVDHMVPLAETYRSGGIDWSTERRAAYANDIEDTRTLIAVTASANRSKSDQDPADWLPPEADYRCRYVANWVAVKVRWSLSMDERERVTVGNILRDCAQG